MTRRPAPFARAYYTLHGKRWPPKGDPEEEGETYDAETGEIYESSRPIPTAIQIERLQAPPLGYMDWLGHVIVAGMWTFFALILFMVVSFFFSMFLVISGMWPLALLAGGLFVWGRHKYYARNPKGP